MPIKPKKQPPYYQQGTNIKRYIATLTQSGTSNPIATVLQNTLGETITWTRDSEGYYKGTVSNPILTIYKTIFKPFGWYGNAVLPIAGDVSVGYWTMSWNDESNIDLYTIDNMTTFNQVELSDITTKQILIEIEIHS